MIFVRSCGILVICFYSGGFHASRLNVTIISCFSVVSRHSDGVLFVGILVVFFACPWHHCVPVVFPCSCGILPLGSHFGSICTFRWYCRGALAIFVVLVAFKEKLNCIDFLSQFGNSRTKTMCVRAGTRGSTQATHTNAASIVLVFNGQNMCSNTLL